MANTITSANVQFALMVAGVFTSPQTLQDFSMDDIFDHDMVEMAQVELGADGIGVAGWVPRVNKQTIRFLPSSRSVLIFETWWQAQDGLLDVLYAAGTLQYPAIGRKFTLYQGALTRAAAAPSAKRVLQPREFEITWMPPQQGTPAIFGQPI